MTTLREQARKAADRPEIAGHISIFTSAACADAASDVWEPLTQELLDRLIEFQEGHPCCDADHDGLITRTKEILH